jgi:hypothetical protein
MKTTSSLIAASALGLVAVFLAVRPATVPSGKAVAPVITKSAQRPVSNTKQVHNASLDPDQSLLSPQSAKDESANREQWQDRLAKILSEHANRDEAIQALVSEMNESYAAWARSEISSLAELSSSERYDRLDDIRNEVEEGAAVVLDQLGINEASRVLATADALDIVTAETQYAEAAPDLDSRLAMLHLDREHELRLEETLAIADVGAQSQASADLSAWYEAGMGEIFSADRER